MAGLKMLSGVASFDLFYPHTLLPSLLIPHFFPPFWSATTTVCRGVSFIIKFHQIRFKVWINCRTYYLGRPKKVLGSAYVKFDVWTGLQWHLSIGVPAYELGWGSRFTSASRVTLAGDATFLHMNTLARLAGTTLGIASVTKCLDLGIN